MSSGKFMPRLRLVTIMLLALAACGVVRAQSADDPPARVARLRYLDGPVSIATAGSTAWFAATPNRPLTGGDAIWTDRDARAELELDGALLHLDGDTDIRWIDLDDSLARLQMAAGTIGVTLRHVEADQRYEIDAPGAAVLLRRAGEYRITVDDGTVIVSVRAGDADISSDNQTLRLSAGQQGVITAANGYTARVEPLSRPDDFDRWCDDRGRMWTAGVGAAYVGAGVVGYEELAQYGAWESVPEYGYVWFPNVVVDDWAPYRFGAWVWIDPWGWTWVDDEPWGFAPFHYGRWAYVARRWCWVPAPPRQRAVYAPALVAWVGTPGAGIPGRGVGWFPLAPGEVYVPARRASPRYVERVNLGNSAMIRPDRIAEVLRDPARQPYLNREAPRAISAVPNGSFGHAQPVPGHMLHGSDLGELRGSAARTAPPQMAPAGRESGGAPALARPPRDIEQRAAAPESLRRRLPERSPEFSPPAQQRRAPEEAPRAASPPAVAAPQREFQRAEPPQRFEPQREPQRAGPPQRFESPPRPREQPAPPQTMPRPPAPAEARPPPQAPQAAPQAQREERREGPPQGESRGRDPHRGDQ
jgi:hypothetical protein